MKRDGSEMVAINGEELLAAPRNLPSAQSSPLVEPAAAHNALSNPTIEELLDDVAKPPTAGQTVVFIVDLRHPQHSAVDVQSFS